MAIFDSTSRFKLTPLVSYDGNIAPAMMKRFDFLDNLPNDQTLYINILGEMSGRPDLISEMLYGTPQYKWVLLLINNVTNPFDEWPKNGTVIKAPTAAAVWREL